MVLGEVEDVLIRFLLLGEKYLEKGKDVYFAFLDLEKAYDRVDRDAMWNVLKLCGIGGRLLHGIALGGSISA